MYKLVIDKLTEKFCKNLIKALQSKIDIENQIKLFKEKEEFTDDDVNLIYENYQRNLFESRSDFIFKNKKLTNEIVKKFLEKNPDTKIKDIDKWLEETSEQDIQKYIKEKFFNKLEEKQFVGKYLLWISKMYVQNKWIFPEDLSKLDEELKLFSKFSNTLEKKDLNQYTFEEFLEALKILEGKKSKKEEKKELKSNEAEKVFENSNWTIIIPKTQEASCLYGKGTRWCTASTEYENYFDYYNKKGPLYIIMNRKNPSEKYQFHWETHSFMNASDEEITMSELNNIISDEEILIKLIEISTKINLNKVDVYKELFKYGLVIDKKSDVVKYIGQDGDTFKFEIEFEKLLSQHVGGYYSDRIIQRLVSKQPLKLFDITESINARLYINEKQYNTICDILGITDKKTYDKDLIERIMNREESLEYDHLSTDYEDIYLTLVHVKDDTLSEFKNHIENSNILNMESNWEDFFQIIRKQVQDFFSVLNAPYNTTGDLIKKDGKLIITLDVLIMDPLDAITNIIIPHDNVENFDYLKSYKKSAYSFLMETIFNDYWFIYTDVLYEKLFKDKLNYENFFDGYIEKIFIPQLKKEVAENNINIDI